VSAPGAPESQPADQPSEGDPEAGVTPSDEARAGEALRASFARLSPQGTDEWNFMGAFTLLGDRFGPYQPGASALADVLAPERGGSRRAGRLGRLGLRQGSPAPGAGAGSGSAEVDKSDFDEAMGHIIEAFRFLHARVSTLEARLGTQDAPLDGAAWLTPARALGVWVDPVAAFVRDRAPGGDVVHADCGDGALVRTLNEASGAGPALAARGVEPRGAVALGALEHGCAVTVSEVDEHLASLADASLGAVVLSGVVDRLALHALLPLLSQCRRTLAPGAPIVVVSEAPAELARRDTVSREVIDGRSLHQQTWELLLARTGFEGVQPLASPDAGDTRFGITATVPTA
jgi:hypothetical protein